jgi:hypothetical protein
MKLEISGCDKVRVTGGRKKGNGVNPASGQPIYRGSTESVRCGSFRRTTRQNGSVSGSSREDFDGFVVDSLKPQPKLRV